MLNSDTDDKSIQSFSVPLEIVREDPKHEQYHYSSTSTYGGDLLLTITYKRNIVKVIFLSYYRNKPNFDRRPCSKARGTKPNSRSLFVKLEFGFEIT